MTLNGYYNKETMSIKNGFQEHTVKGISPMDNRIINSKENFNFQNKNKLYQPNLKLLDEIGKTQQMRQLQRDKREQLSQQVEEISPTGQKRTIVNSASREQTSEKKVMNPFDDRQNRESSKDMFAMPPQEEMEMDPYQQQMEQMGEMDEMDQYQNQMDPMCRKDMPDRPAPVYHQDDYVQSTVTDPMSQ